MRKKERNGPGITTVADSLDPTLVSSSDAELEGVMPGVAAAKLKPAEKVKAESTARRKKEFMNRFADKSVSRKVQTFKIPPRSGVNLNGTIEMRGRKIWTQANPNSKKQS
jgi:hypothetical protein